MELASPRRMKPENAGEEATGKSTRRAFRGGWGQRAWKDQSRSLGGPVGWLKEPTGRGRHNPETACSGVGEASMDVLEAAWEWVRRNKGGPGVDGVRMEQIVESDQGAAGFLEGIQESLRTKTYQPQAVQRVYIAKTRRYAYSPCATSAKGPMCVTA
jgi:hypothetical protein